MNIDVGKGDLSDCALLEQMIEKDAVPEEASSSFLPALMPATLLVWHCKVAFQSSTAFLHRISGTLSIGSR